MRQNYKGDKRRREEAKRKKKEEKLQRKLNKPAEPAAPEVTGWQTEQPAG